MADVDLIFRQAPISQPADLIFGEVENLPDVAVTLAATMPGLTVAIALGSLVQVTLAATMPGLSVAMELAPPAEVTLDATMPGLQVAVEIALVVAVEVIATMPSLTVDMHALYRSEAARPLVGETSSGFQQADGVDAGVHHAQQSGARTPAGWSAGHQAATKEQVGVASGFQDGRSTQNSAAARHQDAQRALALVGTSYANMLRTLRPVLDSTWQGAEGRRSSFTADWQERYRDRRPSLMSSWGEAQRLLTRVADDSAVAVPLIKGWLSSYQEAMKPPPGIYIPSVVVPPAGDPCYTPPLGSRVHLLFDAAWSGDTNLLFICERHVDPEPGDTVVVPVKRVYMVINNTTLMKVVGSTKTAIPTYSMSLTIDVDSWTWGFSASLPASALADLQPDGDGTPQELEASINGQPFRVLAEKLRRDRSFGRDAIKVTGRGKSALLSQPYAPIMTFSNTISRTAQQLMNDALTINGAPIGWSIDWQIEDWVVPGGVWNHQGAYIEALTTIAGAAGAYLQPDPVAQVMRVLGRYPLAPWDWGDMTPDFELPSAVTSTEGIEWLDKTPYNRVFVSGVSAGVIGQVTRGGTAGDVLAPMVTDALITDAIAARQRGRTVLSDTGRQALVSLRLPVLAETGIIVPGKSVRYVDGSDTKVGIVRSTGVEVNGQPDVWQSILVETHVGA